VTGVVERKLGWAGSSIFLLGARIVSKSFTLVYTIAIARSVGENQYGIFGAVVAVSSLVGVISEFGLLLPTIRKISRGADLVASVQETIPARLAATSFGFLVMSAVCMILGYPLFLALSLGLFFGLESISGFFIRSYEGVAAAFRMTALIVAERLALALAVIGVLYIWPGSLLAAAVSMCLAELLAITIVSHNFRWRDMLGWLSISRDELRTKFAAGLPFLIPSLLGFFCYRADAAILASRRSFAEVGEYAAAMRFVEAYTFVPMSMMALVFPRFSQQYHLAHNRIETEFRRTGLIFLLVGILAAVATFALAKPVIGLLYGSRFLGAIPILQVLSFMLFFYTLNYLLSQSLVAINRERSYAMVMAIGSVTSTFGVWIFGGTIGPIGAAWTRVVSEIVMFCAFVFVLVRAWRAGDHLSREVVDQKL
jgi:O-antigen/teichoic acid export membrane protein